MPSFENGGPLVVTPEAARLREIFTRAGYSEKGLVDVFGNVSLPTRMSRDLPYFVHLTSRLRPIDTLARLFLIGEPVPDLDAVRRALDPVPLAVWLDAGLIAVDSGAARGSVRLLPFRELLLACDYAGRFSSAQQDFVMGITDSTIELADFAVSQPVAATLDLGTGSGVQALLAAQRSRRVWATDSSARSLNLARFNAALNGIDNVEFRLGDSFAPVEGETFDVILCNPPFAVTPSRRYSYRDSGMELDGFCRRLLREAPRFLNEGGYCQITCDWVHMAGQDWTQRLASWFDGTGCDAWVLRVDTHAPAAYAHVWIRDTEYVDGEDAARLYRDWISYYERAGVEAISTGLIAIRRRGSAPSHRIRIDEAPATTSGPFGDFVALGFELGDYLETVRDDSRFLEARLRVAPWARLDQACEWSDAAWRIAAARIRLGRGLQYSSDIDLRLAGLVARCDGNHTVGELLGQMAQAFHADLSQIAPNSLALLRQLVERGFLLPRN